MRRAGERRDSRSFPAAPGEEEDERAGSTEPPVLEKDAPFRQVLKSIRDYHGFPTPPETTPHPDRSAMARHLGLPLDHAPALHLPASQLTKALIDDVNAHMRKFGEDLTQGAFLPIPGRRSRRFYRTSEPLFPAPYQIPPGVAPLVQESSTDVKRHPTTFSPSLSSSQEVLLSSACETASWIDLALPACSNFGSRLPADSKQEFERMMLSVGRAVEFLASQVVTALGNHVLAKRDSLLRDPQSMVPVEALSRLRHAPLPSSSAADFPTPLLDEALSKSRASANDALVKKSLHPRGFRKRYLLDRADLVHALPQWIMVVSPQSPHALKEAPNISALPPLVIEERRAAEVDKQKATGPTTTEDLAARVAESGVPEARRESAAAVKVGSCLSMHWRCWQAVGADSWTVSVLRDGYRLPFESPPLLTQIPILFPAYRQGSPQSLVLRQELEKMLAKGALEIVPDLGPGFYSRLFLVEKAMGGWRPVIDLSTLNTFIRQTPFKMETIASVLNAVQENDLLASLDLKDAYFQVPVHPSSRKFLRFVSQGTVYQFKVLCFGLSTAPPSLHESVRSSVSVGAHSRNSAFPLLGRLAGSGLLGDQGPSARPRPSLVVSRSGDHGQRGEVGSHTLTLCELSRDDDRHSGGQGFSLERESGEIPSPGRQLCKDELPPPPPTCLAVGGAPRTSLVAREASSQMSTSVALHAVATEDDLVSRRRFSRSPSRADSGDSRGPVLVDRGVPSFPGGFVRDSSSGPPSVHGRLLCGLGRSPARPKGVREVVRRGKDVAHQSSQGEGSLARTAIFSEDSHRPSSDGNVRQLDSSSVCQQARRNAFSFHVRADQPPSQMDGEHRCPIGSEIPARTEQRPSGSSKPSGSGHCNGVDSPPSGGEGTPERVGLTVDRPVRFETQRSATGLLLPSPGRPGGSRGCVSASLGQPGCVRVSALCSAWKGTVMSTAVSKLFDDSGSSSLGRQGLVRGSTAPADASTSRSASVGRRHSPAPQRSPPPRRPRVETSCVATVKQLLRKSGFSRGAASDMSRCVCESTSNVYQSKWLAFCNWCRGRGVASVNASVPLIVDFFRHLVRDKGLSVPAVRGYRASLNSVFALKGHDLAASREVSMLFRSFSKAARPERLRPPNWDVSLVLQSLTRAPYEPLRSADERFLILEMPDRSQISYCVYGPGWHSRFPLQRVPQSDLKKLDLGTV